jgi:hypothetical protein
MPSALPDPKTGLEKEKHIGDERANHPKNSETTEAPIDGHSVILQYPDCFETKTFNTKKRTRNRNSRTG